MTTDTPSRVDTVRAAIAEHGSQRAAARALGLPESTLRSILKRAEADAAAQAATEATTATERGKALHEAISAYGEAALAEADVEVEAAPLPSVGERLAAAWKQRRIDVATAPRPKLTRAQLFYRAHRRRTRPFRRAFGDRRAVAAAGRSAIAQLDTDAVAIRDAILANPGLDVAGISQRTGLKQGRVRSIVGVSS